jgi:hypothetical protein
MAFLQALNQLLPQDHSRWAFQMWHRQTDPFFFGESASAISSMSVEWALLGHPPAQIGVYRHVFQPFKHEETNHCSLFRRNPKRMCTRLKIDRHLTW